MKYCKKCVYPFVTVNLEISDDGVCSSCRSFEKASLISDEFWASRKEKFKELFKKQIDDNKGYDCLIPVSGGGQLFPNTFNC